MTEQEWLACTEPTPMLDFLKGQDTKRKLRIFACACCHRINNITTDKGRAAVKGAERFADGLIDERELRSLWVAVGFPKKNFRQLAASAARAASSSPGYDGTAHAAASAVNAVLSRNEPRQTDVTRATEWRAQIALLNDIFGNPFRPVTLDPRWLTSTVADLAAAIYQERAFDRMPILADALMDAGCDNETLIAHCRGDGPHVRGCWVVDLLLGKE